MYKREKSNHKFPISYKEVDKIFEELGLNYRTNPKISKNTMVDDKNIDIELICSFNHYPHIFPSKLRYFINNGNGNTGHCKICLALQNKSRNITKIQLVDKFKNHEKHPVKLIDKRFKDTDLIPKKTALKIKCLICGYDGQEVSYNNFFSDDTSYEHKTYQCLGCTKNSKFSCELEDKDVFKILEESGEEVIFRICIKGKKVIQRYELKKMNKKLTYKQLIDKSIQLKKLFEEYNEFKVKAETKGLLLLQKFPDYKGKFTNNKNNYYTFKCIKNSSHIFERQLAWLSKDMICPDCHKIEHDEELTKKFTIEVEKRGGSLSKNQIVSTKNERIECICELGHEFKISFEKLMIGQWCSSCNKGVGERKCRKIFNHIFDVEFRTDHPSWLKNPETNRNLELDGYNEELGIAFEYQGSHHYNNPEVIKKDKIKVAQCKQNNVTLIIIDEFNQNDSDEEKFNIILEECLKNKLPVKNKKFNIDFSDTYKKDTVSVKEQLEKIIEERKSEILVDYQDSNIQVRIQCKNKNHEPFTMTPNNIVYHNGWCNKCKKEEN